jgi:hypothetical protein
MPKPENVRAIAAAIEAAILDYCYSPSGRGHNRRYRRRLYRRHRLVPHATPARRA